MIKFKFILLAVCCWGSSVLLSAQHLGLYAPKQVSSVIQKQVQESSDGKVLYGYCSPDVTITKNSGFGYTISGDIKCNVAIRFSEGLLHILNGRKIYRLRVGAALPTEDATVFIRNAQGEDVWTKTISLEQGWNDVILDTPLPISETKELYFGFTYIQKNKTFVAAAAGVSYETNGLFLSSGDAPLEEYPMIGNLCFLVEVEGVPAEFEYIASVASVYTPSPYKYKGETGQMDVTIFNEGEKKITRAKFARSFNGTALSDTSFLFKRSVQPHSTAILSFPITAEVSGTYTYTLKEIEEKPVGTSSRDAAISVYNPAESFNRMVLIEEFTSQKCGNCPKGQTTLHKTIAGNEDRVALVLHHSGFDPDAFTLEESEEYCYFYNSLSTYAPAIMMDRTYIPDYISSKTITPVFSPSSLIKSRFLKEVDLPSMVSVNIKSSYEEATKKLKVIVSGKKIVDLVGDRVGLTVFLLESKYIAEQATAGGMNNKFEHNNFPRHVFSDVKGDVLTFNEDGTYSKEYTYTIPDSYTAFYTDIVTESHPENMHIVAFVANYDTKNPGNCAVLNANKTSSLNDEVTTSAGTGVESTQANTYSMYAVDGTVYVSGEYESLSVYTLQGMPVRNNSLMPGIYIVKVKDANHKEYVGKVLVQ